MKDQKIKVLIEQLAVVLRDESQLETDTDRSCALLDANEYLRRAWHAIDGSPCSDNQTTIEAQSFMRL